MNTINEQRWMKLAGIITENEVNEANEASAWLVYEKDNHPLVLRFASADRAEAKKIEMEEDEELDSLEEEVERDRDNGRRKPIIFDSDSDSEETS